MGTKPCSNCPSLDPRHGQLEQASPDHLECSNPDSRRDQDDQRDCHPPIPADAGLFDAPVGQDDQDQPQRAEECQVA